MDQSVSYIYGYGGFTLTGDPNDPTTQLGELQARLITVQQNLTIEGEGGQIYSYLTDLLSTFLGNPISGVDPSVFAWLKGAQGVNAATSAAGIFIRSYTSTAYQIRYGTAPTIQQLDFASNQIAINVAEGILSHQGQLPSIVGIGAADAGSAASNIFNGVYAPWAGTLLFPYLSEPDFYTTWLLNMNTVSGTVPDPATGGTDNATFKSIGGAYDLVASLEAYQDTVVSDPFNAAEAAFTGFRNETADPSSLAAQTMTFLLTSYGLTTTQFPTLGEGTPFAGTSILESPDYVAGTIAKDEIQTDEENNMVVEGGPGDDLIFGVMGGGIIDGGGGINTIDYSAVDPSRGSFTFTLEQPNTNFFNYRFEVTSGEDPTSEFLYEIQDINGNDGGDTLKIPVLSSSLWTSIGQFGSIDLGGAVVANSTNQLLLDGSGSDAYGYFSISEGAEAKELLVSAVASTSLGAGGIEVVNPGTVTVTAGNNGSTLSVSGDLSAALGNEGVIYFIEGSGTDVIDTFGLTVAQKVNVSMGDSETLRLTSPSNFSGTISHFVQGDTIDLAGIGTASAATLGAGNILTVGSIALQLDPAQDYSNSSFTATSDGNGGTDVTIGGKEDLAFVIDTTGSMTPYIAAVQDDAVALINAAFNGGTNNTQVGVVSFKDPQAGYPDDVTLPFTTQPDYADRQTAAVNAIDSLGADGGGDIPEGDYSGLLLALDGSMGAWREGASIHRIVLFTDAPVKDTYLAAMVNQDAANLGLNPAALTGDPPGDPPVQVQIYTIQVGDDPTATASVQEIATDNRGEFFAAPTPTDLTNALLNIITLPPTTPTPTPTPPSTLPPTISVVAPSTVEKTQTTVIGTVTPGVAGDTLTLSKTTGAGSLILGAVQADGTQQVIYTAPASIAASTIDAVSYTIAENGVNATGSSTVQLDAGPSIAAQTPTTVESGQTTIIGNVTPGLAGDTLTLTETAGAGTLSLTPVQADGTQQIIYTAPATISASEVDQVAYTIADQYDDAAASATASVQLDAGPSVTLLPFAPSAADKGVTVATATPGLATDTLNLDVIQTPQKGTLSLQGNSVQYTGDTGFLSKPVTFSFDLKDQLGGVTPTETVIVSNDLLNDVTGSTTGNTDISLGFGLNQVKLSGNGNVVDAEDGASLVAGGVSNNTIALGGGLDSVTLSGGNNTITLGNGADDVTVGGSENNIKLGNGLDVVHGGNGDTINLANTRLTLYGTNEMVFLGTGNATVNDFSTGIDLRLGPTAGKDVLTDFASDPSGVIDLIGGIGGFTTSAAALAALKSDGHSGMLLSFGNGSSLDFAGVALSQLHASNFQIG